MVSKILQDLSTPPKDSLSSHFILGEIIDHISLLESEFPDVRVPLLKSHLWDIRNKNVDPQSHLRGFLKVFEETPVFKDAFEQLAESMRTQIRIFIAGASETVVLAVGGVGDAFHLPPSPQVKRHFGELKEKLERLFHHEKHEDDGANGDVQKDWVVIGSYPRIFEDEKESRTMEVYGNQEFHNWGQNVQNTPLWTFVPKTVIGVQNLVKWAKINDLRVRCSGYRHSWSSTFSQDKQILVSLLNLEEVTKLPDHMSLLPDYVDPENELKTIQLVAPPGVIVAEGKALCRVGVSVTNEQFRRWAVENDKWTLPVDVILVEVTIGGVNGPICHGAGRQHQTVNDSIVAIEYVDANGVHRTVFDPGHLKAAAGCFGLLGIVTHITFSLDKMRYAVLKPVKPDISLAIPPLSRADIPIAIRKTFTDAQYAAALTDFESRATNDYYSEWFWFTRSQQAFGNTWNPVTSPSGSVPYPSPFQTWCQWVQGWLGSVITGNPIFNAFPGRWQAEILATFSMICLPPFEFTDFGQGKTEEIKCALPDALHFRRGIQNMRVRDLEFQIPIPSLATNPSLPDYSIVRRAWWDIINLCYEDDATPMRLALELRIMGDSEMIMAPQRGNKHGTASIEVLSVPDAVSEEVWVPFLQRVCDLWMGYRDSNGVLLDVRPHWAKEWESVNMRGKPAREYLRDVAYRDAIPEFRDVLRDIGSSQGWGLEDIRKRFSNELWDYMIFS